MAFDAFYQTEAPLGGPPDGGTFDKNTLDLGMDGRITSVTVDPGSVSKGLVTPTDFDVEFRLDARLLSQTVIPFSANVIFLTSTFVTQGGAHDWFVTQTGLGTILNGVLNTPLTISGVVNLLVAPNNVTVDELVSGSNLTITGGDPDLVNALGGAGNGAVLELRQVIFNFMPSLINLAADLNVFNTNFTFAASGTITPKTNAPFVPEPASALMLGMGLIGLLAAGRRLKR